MFGGAFYPPLKAPFLLYFCGGDDLNTGLSPPPPDLLRPLHPAAGQLRGSPSDSPAGAASGATPTASRESSSGSPPPVRGPWH